MIEFGSFKRDGKTYNCAYDTNDTNSKGLLYKYFKHTPKALNFYCATDTCRVKLKDIGNIQKD